MKNKSPLVILVMLLVFTSIGGVFAKDIVYVAKDSSSVDSSIVDLIEAKNYSHDIVYRTDIDSTNFSDYRVLIVGEGNFGSDSFKIPVNEMNSVILNKNHLDDWNWLDGSVSILSSSQPSKAVIFQDDDPVVLGLLNKTFNVYEYSQTSIISYTVFYISKSKKASGVNTVVADDLTSQIFGGNPRKGAVVASVKKDSQLLNNNISNSRGVFIGFTDSNLWTNDSNNIFYNSIDWVKKGDDFDNDGFFGDFDCNDEDPAINPNATEIPYDGIDQDCSGEDFLDVDLDGFDADFAGGNDCNDNDSSYNINSTDLTKNCVNDAPIIQLIDKSSNPIVHEGENASFSVNIFEPEGDLVEYFTNDSRFVVDGNYFSWQTNYDDEGSYEFFVFVSDGNLTSQEVVSIKVWNRNKAPDLLSEIPIQEWDEDTNHTLNLTEYFSDHDGDDLLYLFHNSSDDLNIKLEKIVEGVAHFSSEENWFGQDWIIFKVSDGINNAYTNKITLNVLAVNDPPKLINEIGNLSFNEDSNYTIDLPLYFSDIDSHLSYQLSNNENFSFEIYNETLKIIPNENWFGNEVFNLIASDSEYNISSSVNLQVNPLNDAPTIGDIEEIITLAGSLIEINVNATDIENDTLSYFVNDSRFVQNDNYFSWNTTENDFGFYTFEFSVNDSFETVSKEVKVTVLQKILINEFEVGENGWIEIYNPKDQTFNLSGCFINNSNNDILNLSGEIEYEGFVVFGWDMLDEDDLIELYCYDNFIDSVSYNNLNEGSSYGRENNTGDFIIFEYPTKGLTNNADMISPILEVYSPLNNSYFNETREIDFEFKVQDNLEENLECSLFIDGNKEKTIQATNDSLGVFEMSFSDSIYSWMIECIDSINKVSSEEFIFEVSAPDNPVLNSISDKQVSENELLKFTVSATDSDGESLKLYAENLPEGSSFIDNNDGTGEFSWTPYYNQSGTYEVKFTVEDEKGLKDSKDTKITVNNKKEPPKFSDSEICEIKDNLIEIDIREPDNGDEFELDEKIEGEIRLENNFEEDLDFDYDISLYDTSEEEVVEDLDDDIDVDEDDSEKIEFEFEIPDDIEDNDFAIYVYVEDEEGRCNSEFVEIDIEREKHDVRIDEISIVPSIVSSGDNLEVVVKIENLGLSDEDVYIEIENSEIGILEKSEEFEIEEFGDDDKESETFYIEIPENAEEKTYEIKATVFFDDGDEEHFLSQSFEILNRVEFETVSNNDEIILNPEINLIRLENSDKNDAPVTSSINLENSISINDVKNDAKISFSKIIEEKDEGNNFLVVLLVIFAFGIAILIFAIKIFTQRL